MNSELDRMAFDFFKLFAQYEFTLKERGFFIFRGGKIIVDWDRFANEVIGANFLDDLGNLKSHAEYILENPPKKQTVNANNQIIWENTPNRERSVQILFSHISRIRNNLFHGAKFNGTWFDPERSLTLLKNGLVVLNYFKNRVNID